MTERVKIDSTAASPFRVSAAGVDVNLAEFADLIFDGNQSPLRLWGTGWGTVAGNTYDEWTGGKNTEWSGFVAGPVTPAGTTPVFMTMWRPVPSGFVRTPLVKNIHSQASAGGGFSSGSFYGLSFSVGTPVAPSTRPSDVAVNYAIFKNYQ